MLAAAAEALSGSIHCVSGCRCGGCLYLLALLHAAVALMDWRWTRPQLPNDDRTWMAALLEPPLTATQRPAAGIEEVGGRMDMDMRQRR